MDIIKFVRNYNDLSTNSGFQFEFFCDRCGSGYQTRFEASAAGTIAGVLDTAGSLLGGVFSAAASLGEQARSATWEKAHDDAFQRAIEQARPHFKQCRRCGHWLDEICWNPERGICKECAPDLETEYSVLQTQAAMEQARETAKTATYVTDEKFKEALVVACANCNAAVGGAKFCPECGTPVKRTGTCKGCGAEAAGKFCPECGAAQ
jgi:hypothetical protein